MSSNTPTIVLVRFATSCGGVKFRPANIIWQQAGFDRVRIRLLDTGTTAQVHVDSIAKG